MWFTFVERSSNAFGTRHDENFSEITKTRDDIKDFTPTDSIHRKTPKNCYGRKKDFDAIELSSEIAREDFYEGDKMLVKSPQKPIMVSMNSVQIAIV